MTARTLRIALLSCLFALAVPALAVALVRTVPVGTASALLGPRMIRAEIGIKPATGPIRDFRVDRGRLLRRYAARQLVVVERDSPARVPLPVAPNARVLLNGKLVGVRSLRAGMQVAVPRDGDAPAEIVYARAKSAPAIPKTSIQYWLGGRMFRAEIAYLDTVLHDYRLDHGRLKQVGPYTLTLHEADGTTVPLSAAATVRVKLNGKIASFAQLRKGMTATVMRDGDKPADQIWAAGK